MNTIKNNCQNELIIKNSRFICYLYKINSLDDVSSIINNLKDTYNDATHYCYAYIINNVKKSSDDGEPSGTAGIPILKVLNFNNLTNILAVVIRYFGGIKLGANGLIRAYNKSITECLNKTPIIKLINGLSIKITFNYNRLKEIDYLLKNTSINYKEFNNQITYIIDIEESFLNTLILLNINYQILEKKIIEKSS